MLTINLDAGRFDTKATQGVIDQINRAIGEQTDAVINVKVLPLVEVQGLNKQYGHKDEPTDVLAFRYGDPIALSSSRKRGIRISDQASLAARQVGNDTQEMGDVAISRQHVIKQAKLAGTDQATELALLTLHGILHLLGYDHAKMADRAKMDGLQLKIMLAAGLSYRNFAWQN